MRGNNGWGKALLHLRVADEAQRRFLKADALVLRGVPPARVKQVISKGLESMAEALGLLHSEKSTDGKLRQRGHWVYSATICSA